MKQLIKTFVLLLVLLVGVASCGKDEPDGMWEKMKWEEPSGLTKGGDGIYLVPASGGTFKFTCKNYQPWIAQISDYYELTSAQDVSSYQGSWYSVNCVKSEVTFTFRPLTDEDDTRELMVTLTAGDIFDYFKFIQRP